jgi:hypothetical protein
MPSVSIVRVILTVRLGAGGGPEHPAQVEAGKTAASNPLVFIFPSPPRLAPRFSLYFVSLERVALR